MVDAVKLKNVLIRGLQILLEPVSQGAEFLVS